MRQLVNKHIILIRYFFIGVSAAGIDVAIYAVLFNLFDFSAILSTTISISIATIYAFTLNMVYNFQIKGRVMLRLLSYTFVSGVGLVISAGLLYVFTNIQGYDGNVVKILSLPLIFVVQYFLNKSMTFRTSDGSTLDPKDENII